VPGSPDACTTVAARRAREHRATSRAGQEMTTPFQGRGHPVRHWRVVSLPWLSAGRAVVLASCLAATQRTAECAGRTAELRTRGSEECLVASLRRLGWERRCCEDPSQEENKASESQQGLLSHITTSFRNKLHLLSTRSKSNLLSHD
jgi:hypothetical protein